MRTTLTIITGALSLSASAHAQQAVQWRVEDGGNGHWYAAIRPDPMPTTMAGQDMAAQALGGHMATLKSPAENALAVSLLSGLTGEANGAFIGLRRDGATPVWRWVDGDVAAWSAWGSANCWAGPYPNNPGVGGQMVCHLYMQNCGWVWDDTPPSWFTDSVTLKLIVEWSADCNADGIVDYGQCRDGSLPDQNANNVPDCCEGIGTCCVGDILVDQVVNGADLGGLLSYWGPVTTSPVSQSCDLNNDGVVGGGDLGLLLANWGDCP